MPQVDLKYSNDIKINDSDLFQAVEQCINELDDGAGCCKCRAYPSSSYLHSHVFLTVSIIDKPHRDEDFMRELLQSLRDLGKSFISTEYHFSVEVKFLSQYYESSNGIY